MISVVIPLYNKEHTIKETLGSVLNQTFSEFEVVIVDDGSNDNGVRVINEFTNDHRVKIIKQDNQGVSVARNKGVENSRYDYIAFLDGDDLWELEYLEKMNEAIIKYPEAGMYCCAGKVRSGDTSLFRIAEKYKEQILPINFFDNPHVFLHTSATIIAKKYFESSRKFPVGMKRNQDLAFFFSIALISKVVYCGFPLSIYVGDVEGQATSTPFVSVMKHIAKRFNHVHKTYKLTEQKNKDYLIFLRYELRHMFKVVLVSYGIDTLKIFLSYLDDDILGSFPFFEIKLYKKERYQLIALKYITMQKIRWRLRGKPRVIVNK